MENELRIAENILRLRKAAGKTQEELASYLGVTKAAVSKWETGQALPDVAMLPKLATYFGVTVDELMGYEPQLNRQEIRDIYNELRGQFATGPFEEAEKNLRKVAHDYWSCYTLLAYLAQLALNNADFAPDEQAGRALLDDAMSLCQRVRANSHDDADVKLANVIESMIALSNGYPQQVVELLSPAPQPYAGDVEVLASAYRMLGDTARAEQTLQAELYQSVVSAASALCNLAQMHVGNLARVDALYERFNSLRSTFDLDSIWPSVPSVIISFAMVYAAGGSDDKAIACLGDYVEAGRRMKWPPQLSGDGFFDALDGWIDETIASGAEAPRDEASAKRSMVAGLTENPAFASLQDDERFKKLVARLKTVLE